MKFKSGQLAWPTLPSAAPATGAWLTTGFYEQESAPRRHLMTSFVFCRKKTERSKKFFTDLMAKEHVPTMINPKPCGHLCCCAIAGCEEVKTKTSPPWQNRARSHQQLLTRLIIQRRFCTFPSVHQLRNDFVLRRMSLRYVVVFPLLKCRQYRKWRAGTQNDESRSSTVDFRVTSPVLQVVMTSPSFTHIIQMLTC